MKRVVLVLLMVITVYFRLASADPFIRYNQAGYTPDRPKSLIVISKQDLKGQSWKITYNDSVILEGNVTASVAGIGSYTSYPYNHEIDFSVLKKIGDYDFLLGTTHARLHIAEDPYSVFITDALRHLRTVRSGTNGALHHGFSHGGDSAAIAYTINGDPSRGKWIEAASHQTIDALGGWYDAGDYIKFTLTIANTVYILLEAYEANPKAFTKVISGSDLPDVLDEAQFGLSWLLKTHPSNDLFVIQVGSEPDHWEPLRLPEDDALDGKRPALCAISPVHMGITAATLAKGARVFKSLGKDSIASVYLSKAKEIFSRAQQSDALKVCAYEKGQVNDFYKDNSVKDNMGIGAAELFLATGDTTYLNIATTIFTPSQGYWFSWAQYHFFVNKLLAPYSEKNKGKAQSEIDYFISRMDSVWGISLEYTWASMIPWNGVGAAAAEWNRIVTTTGARELHLKMVDLLFGRNNWGLSFIASPRLPNTIHSCYNPVYRLNNLFPLGAVALGPGDKATHDEVIKDFGQPPGSPIDSFQTSDGVFYDYDRDYMSTETSISSQAFAIWMLALACDTGVLAKADTGMPAIKTIQPITDSIHTFIPENNAWFTFSDSANGGKSTAQWIDTANHTMELIANAGYQFPYIGFGFQVPADAQGFSHYDAIRLHGYFEKNAVLFLGMQMSQVTDDDCHGQYFLGKDTSAVQIVFSEANQRGWGTYMPFNPSKIVKIRLTYGNTMKPAVVRIDSISLVRFTNHQNVSVKHPLRDKLESNHIWMRNGLKLTWKNTVSTELQLVDIQGRLLWKKVVMPGQVVTLPKYKGFQLLVAKRNVLDKWIGF
jgi:hypothetical protein